MIRGLRPRFVWGTPAEAAPDRGTVLRYLGHRPGRTHSSAAAEAAVDAGIAAAGAVLAPRAALVDCAVAAVDREAGLSLASGVAWQSRELARRLAGARAVTVIAATVGEGIETETDRRFRAGEYAEATVVDAAGTAAIQTWLQTVQRRLAAADAVAGLTLTAAWSPGWGDWAVDDLPGLLAITAAHRAGIECNSARCLLPQKSLVAVVGWVDRPAAAAGAADPAGAVTGLRAAGCGICTQRDCRYRCTDPERGRTTWIC